MINFMFDNCKFLCVCFKNEIFFQIFVESTTKTGSYGQKEELDRGEEGLRKKVFEYQTGIQIYVQ